MLRRPSLALINEANCLIYREKEKAVAEEEERKQKEMDDERKTAYDKFVALNDEAQKYRRVSLGEDGEGPSPGEMSSETAEGIRRVNKQIAELEKYNEELDAVYKAALIEAVPTAAEK